MADKFKSPERVPNVDVAPRVTASCKRDWQQQQQQDRLHRKRTFALIKSGAVARGQAPDIIRAIEAAGIKVADVRIFTPLSQALAKTLYAEHEEKSRRIEQAGGQGYWEGLIKSVTGEKGTYALCLEGDDDVIQRWRALMGPTNPVGAPKGTIRGDFGGEALPDNAVHGSDSEEAAQHEIGLFFSSRSS